MNFLVIFYFLFLCACSREPPAPLTPQAEILEPVILKAQVDKALAGLSDTMTFSLILNTDESVKATIPEVGSHITSLRVVDFGLDKTEKEGTRLVSRRWYKLQADIAGTYVLPSAELTYVDAEGKEATVRTAEIFVEVTAPKNKDSKNSENSKGQTAEKKPEEDIRDIKSIEDVPLRPPLWVWLGGFFLIIASAVGVFLYLKHRNRPSKVSETPPHEEALAQLEKLERENLLEQNEIKPFHFALSHISRSYFERRYLIPVTDMTLEQIRSQVHSVPSLTSDQANQFLAFLNDTDMVKFTDFTPPRKKNLETLESIRSFILETSPADARREEQSVV